MDDAAIVEARRVLWAERRAIDRELAMLETSMEKAERQQREEEQKACQWQMRMSFSIASVICLVGAALLFGAMTRDAHAMGCSLYDIWVAKPPCMSAYLLPFISALVAGCFTLPCALIAWVVYLSDQSIKNRR